MFRGKLAPALHRRPECRVGYWGVFHRKDLATSWVVTAGQRRPDLRVEIDPRFVRPGSTPGRHPAREVGYRVVGEAFSIRLTERRPTLDREISVRSPDGERCRIPGQGDCIRKWPSAGSSSQIVTAG